MRFDDTKSKCRKCGAPILWAKAVVERGERWVPLDPEPRKDGVMAVASAAGGRIARLFDGSGLTVGLPRHNRHECRRRAA